MATSIKTEIKSRTLRLRYPQTYVVTASKEDPGNNLVHHRSILWPQMNYWEAEASPGMPELSTRPGKQQGANTRWLREVTLSDYSSRRTEVWSEGGWIRKGMLEIILKIAQRGSLPSWKLAAKCRWTLKSFDWWMRFKYHAGLRCGTLNRKEMVSLHA